LSLTFHMSRPWETACQPWAWSIAAVRPCTHPSSRRGHAAFSDADHGVLARFLGSELGFGGDEKAARWADGSIWLTRNAGLYFVFVGLFFDSADDPVEG